ncbi:hypothetical protein Tco_1316042 [Tanacetum coccineum]
MEISFSYHETLKTRLARKTSLKKKGVQKGYVSKQGRKSVKSFKGEPSVHKDPAFDDLDDIVDDAMDYMMSKDGSDEGDTVKPNEGTDKRNEGTDKQDGGTDSTKVSTDRQDEGTADQNEGKNATQTAPTTTSTPTPTIFGDDETIAQIDPKDKGKKRIEEEDESDTESEDITEAEKKFKQLANDEEVARKVQEEWEAEEEKKRLDEEEATKAALSNEYDFIQARLNADKILAEKLQEEEREIHVGGKKHSDLKTKSFDEIQVLYEKIKRSDDSFIAIGSAEDEKMIKEMNEQAADASKKRVKKDDSVKGEIKEEGTRKRKLGKRKKMKSKKRKFTSKDDEELRLCLTIASDEDKEVDYEILDKKYPIIEWRSEYLTTKPQYDETKEVEDVYLNVVIRSNRQRRYFSTLMAVLLHTWNRE